MTNSDVKVESNNRDPSIPGSNTPKISDHIRVEGKKTIIKVDNDEIEFFRVPWVISINNNYGLIRCHHRDTPKTIGLLNNLNTAGKGQNPIKITTLGTTGTIRSARKKYLDKLILYPLSNIYTKRV